jgi:hypothetical protein
VITAPPLSWKNIVLVVLETICGIESGYDRPAIFSLCDTIWLGAKHKQYGSLTEIAHGGPF